MKLNIVKVEVLPSLSLKNETSRSILRGPSRGPNWAPRFPKNFEAVACLCFIKNLLAVFLSFCARDAQNFLPLHRLFIYYIYRENRV